MSRTSNRISLLTIFIVNIASSIIAMDTDQQLVDAAYNGNITMVRQLIAQGADVNATVEADYTPLMEAAQQGHSDIVKLLISAGADVNAINADADTALTTAINSGHMAVVQTLITAGANVNDDRTGHIPIMEAVIGEHLDIVRLLIKSGADVNANEGIYTPLMAATEEDRADIVQLLLRAGANVNAMEDIDGDPALIIATLKGNLNIIKLLIAAGADLNLQNMDGKTALEIALEKRQRAKKRKRHEEENPQNAPDYDAVVKLLQNAEQDIETITHFNETLRGQSVLTLLESIPEDLLWILYDALRLRQEYPVQWKQFITDKR